MDLATGRFTGPTPFSGPLGRFSCFRVVPGHLCPTLAFLGRLRDPVVAVRGVHGVLQGLLYPQGEVGQLGNPYRQTFFLLRPPLAVVFRPDPDVQECSGNDGPRTRPS